jgi:hypothetical protein
MYVYGLGDAQENMWNDLDEDLWKECPDCGEMNFVEYCGGCECVNCGEQY